MWRAVVLVGFALALSACGGGTPAARTAAARSDRGSGAPARLAVPAAGRLLNGSRLLLDVLELPSAGYATAGSLYLAHTVPAAEHTEEIYELTRVDPATGRVTAVRRFSTTLDQTLRADGSLWVTTSGGGQTLLWRMDPQTLAVRSEVSLPTSRDTEGITGSMAAAGGHLWVGAGTLDRVSLSIGHVDRVLTPRYRGPVQVAADPTGRVLLASLGYEHPTYIARLNARTGALLSTVEIPRSVSQPTFGGIVDGGAWIENTVGMTTTARRLDATTLKTTRTNAWAVASKRISVQVIDGVLWVTEPTGQDNLNYCADPVTGRPRAQLPLLRGDSVFLTANASSSYYTEVPVNAHSVQLERASIRGACTS